ncbi:hypothetical protein I7I51_00106 [Histoplasma capsulatum]|uniref:Uncharacterized protein n=1 Tax=Ajellomyces capsulatus TaxID=5037 RepID=A0A8A1MAS0_AJECA|nr:hypothetical protein I7I51_00106 [Histoplasma capsulatum]
MMHASRLVPHPVDMGRVFPETNNAINSVDLSRIATALVPEWRSRKHKLKIEEERTRRRRSCPAGRKLITQGCHRCKPSSKSSAMKTLLGGCSIPGIDGRKICSQPCRGSTRMKQNLART